MKFRKFLGIKVPDVTHSPKTIQLVAKPVDLITVNGDALHSGHDASRNVYRIDQNEAGVIHAVEQPIAELSDDLKRMISVLRDKQLPRKHFFIVGEFEGDAEAFAFCKANANWRLFDPLEKGGSAA